MATIPVDYEILRLVWWLFLGVLLIGFAIMDGFDLGVAMLLPYVARTDIERRVTINAIGPVWEGNQVWLILGAGAVFAAWPPVYATSFSGFYIAMFLVLATFILRPVGFEFRNKVADTRWRTFWDYALFAGGLVPSVVFGVAFGNLLQGVPFHIDSDLRVLYEGSGLFELLNPFGLLCGLVSAAMLATHGAIYLTLKTNGPIRQRAQEFIKIGAMLTAVLFGLAGLWVWVRIRRLCHHQRGDWRRAVESSHEDGRSPAGPVARQLRDAPLDDRGALPRHNWSAARAAPDQRPKARACLHGQCARHFWHHRDRRREHVPLPAAVERRTSRELDRMGCLIEFNSPCS